MDVRQLSRAGGIETLVDLTHNYLTSGCSPLAADNKGQKLFVDLCKSLKEGFDHVRLDDFPFEQAMEYIMRHENEVEDVAGYVLMCVVATGDWQILRKLSEPILEDSTRWPFSTWPASYTAGMVLGVLESLSWLYLPGERHHYFVEHGNQYAKYPPYFLGELLSCDNIQVHDDPAEDHPVFGRISNLVGHIIEGPLQDIEDDRKSGIPENATEHRKMLDNMFLNIRNGFDRLAKEGVRPSRLALGTAERLASKYYYSQDPRTKLEWVGYRSDTIPRDPPKHPSAE